jgi:hypothetical protein
MRSANQRGAKYESDSDPVSGQGGPSARRSADGAPPVMVGEAEEDFPMSEIMYEQKPPHVYAAIAEVMAKVAKEGISKSRKNQQQGYNFRGIDDVYNALAPFLSEAKLCILPRVLSRQTTERETKNGNALFYVVLDVEFDLVSGLDASKHTVRVIGEAMDSADKATNKAMSAAYKYACMEVFCIPTEGDNDADATTHEVQPERNNTGWTAKDTKRANEFASKVIQYVDEGRDVMEIWDEITPAGEEFVRAVWVGLPKPIKTLIKDENDKRNKAKAAA